MSLILFPAVWTATFFYARPIKHRGSAGVVPAAVLAVNGAGAGWSIWDGI